MHVRIALLAFLSPALACEAVANDAYTGASPPSQFVTVGRAMERVPLALEIRFQLNGAFTPTSGPNVTRTISQSFDRDGFANVTKGTAAPDGRGVAIVSIDASYDAAVQSAIDRTTRALAPFAPGVTARYALSDDDRARLIRTADGDARRAADHLARFYGVDRLSAVQWRIGAVTEAFGPSYSPYRSFDNEFVVPSALPPFRGDPQAVRVSDTLAFAGDTVAHEPAFARANGVAQYVGNGTAQMPGFVDRVTISAERPQIVAIAAVTQQAADRLGTIAAVAAAARAERQVRALASNLETPVGPTASIVAFAPYEFERDETIVATAVDATATGDIDAAWKRAAPTATPVIATPASSLPPGATSIVTRLIAVSHVMGGQVPEMPFGQGILPPRRLRAPYALWNDDTLLVVSADVPENAPSGAAGALRCDRLIERARQASLRRAISEAFGRASAEQKTLHHLVFAAALPPSESDADCSEVHAPIELRFQTI